MFQTQWRLNVTTRLLLAEDVGDVVWSEGLCRICLLQRGGDSFRPVIANQFQKLTNLPARLRSVSVSLRR